jgi:ferredoxin
MEDRAQTRRDFMKMVSMGALAGLSLGSLSCSQAEVEDFLQKRFREMSAEEKKQVIKRLEARYLKKYGKKFTISTQEPDAGVLWGYGLDIARCIGCRRCVYGCVNENNQSRKNPQLQWIRVIRQKKGSMINLENSEHYYNPDHQHLLDLGYKPTHDIEKELGSLITDLMKHKERIAAFKEVLIPDIRWDGTQRKSKYIR